jgi:hypothetical protein
MRFLSLRSITKLALALVLAGSAAGCTLSASGRLNVPMIVVEEAPPPPPPQPRVEARTNYIWIVGYQRWDGGRYVWQEGRYERMRPGYVYAPGRWQRQGKGHVYVQGEWKARGGGRAKARDHRRG